jgi:hypothetical protein
MDMQSAASAFAAAAATFSAVVAIGTLLPAWCTRKAEAEMENEPSRVVVRSSHSRYRRDS